MYFVYRGAVTDKIYIERIAGLGNPKVIAAFETREEAVEYGLAQTFAVVVVERGISIQGGDENNLISKIDYEPPVCPIPPPALPTLTGTIQIVGVPEEGEELGVDHSQLGGSGQIQYQWTKQYDRGDPVIDIITAQASTHLLENQDVGYVIGVRVSRVGYIGEIESLFIGPVLPKQPIPLTGTIEVLGNIQVGETLSVDISNLGGSGDISYQWGDSTTGMGLLTDISGANGEDYTLTLQEENKYVGVRVTRQDNSGGIQSPYVGPIIGP